MQWPKPTAIKKKHKYSAKKTERDGRTFDSKAEASLYDILWLREKAGEITELKCQVQIHLTRAKVIYKPDFSFIENDTLIYAEFKGCPTPSWNIKKRLWKVYGPGPLRIYGGKAGYVRFTEEIIPKG